MSVAQGYKANSFWFLVGVGALALTVVAVWAIFGWLAGVIALGTTVALGAAFVIQQIRSSLRGI